MIRTASPDRYSGNRFDPLHHRRSIPSNPRIPVKFTNSSHTPPATIRAKISSRTTKESESNFLWKYILLILYGVFGILLLIAVILPSIFVYILAPISSQTGLVDSSTHTNHCAGVSPRTLWQINSTSTITMKIDTTQCNFLDIPLYFVSMAGTDNHFCLQGYNGIYFSSKESFQIYVQYACAAMNSTDLLALSQTSAHDVNWVGFYK